MNATQIHLALTHVPVILSFVGLILLVISAFTKNNTLVKTSLFVLLAAGLFTIPVYLTGEGTEHAIENLPGVSELVIERHEEVAQLSMLIISVSALAAGAGLVFFSRALWFRVIRLVVFIGAFASAAAMAQTAHLGGQIRHSEIRPGGLAANGQTTEPAGEEEQGTAGSATDAGDQPADAAQQHSHEDDED